MFRILNVPFYPEKTQEKDVKLIRFLIEEWVYY